MTNHIFLRPGDGVGKRVRLHILATLEPLAATLPRILLRVKRGAAWLYRRLAKLEARALRLHSPTLEAKDALWVWRENRRAAR